MFVYGQNSFPKVTDSLSPRNAGASDQADCCSRQGADNWETIQDVWRYEASFLFLFVFFYNHDGGG